MRASRDRRGRSGRRHRARRGWFRPHRDLTSWLWRFDWSPPLRDLVVAEAAALNAGDPIAPGLFLGSTPFAPGRAAYAVGGGRVLSQGPPQALELPPGCRHVHVAKGPWKPPGDPIDFAAQLPGEIAPARRSLRLKLFPTDGDWFLVQAGPEAPAFSPPDLPIRTSTSLSSQLARAVVNLVARPGDTVLDPVCGTGVLLCEAARIGCRVVGSDLLRKAYYSARKNLAAMGLAGEVRVADALAPSDEEPYDALVGDLPYGIRLPVTDLSAFAKALPKRARRWALVAHMDLTQALTNAGHPPRQTMRVPKTTFTRYVHVGGEACV